MMSFFKTVVLSLVVSQVFADTKMLQQAEVKSFIQDMVQRHHFKASELEKTLTEAQYKPVRIAPETTSYS